MSPRSLAHPTYQTRGELRDVEREIGNLTRAIAAGGSLEPLLFDQQAREVRRAELARVIAAQKTLP